MEEILNNYGTEIAGTLGVAIGWVLKKLWIILEGYIARTPNSFDDVLLNKIEETIKEALQTVSEKQK